MFFNFGYDDEEPQKEEKKRCEHEKDWDWPQVKKHGDKYKVILAHHCRLCGDFYE